MNASAPPPRARVRRVSSLVTAAVLAVAMAGTALAGLASGSLPSAAFTYTSVTTNAVNMDGNGIHLKVKAPVNVKTTYTILPPSTSLTGWHYHNGPVIVTVAVGTITYFDANCHTWDVSAGQTYIESTGQVLNARLDPAKNTAPVEWFSTRLYPAGTTDPVGVPAPCNP
jgi:hypothetical protein